MTPVSIVLKATALLTAAALVHAVLRRRGSAAARHLVWTSVLAALLALPLAEAALPHWTLAIPIAVRATAEPIPEAASAAPITLASADAGPRALPAASPLPPRPQSGVPGWATVAVVLYPAGVLLLIARVLFEFIALRRLASASREVVDSGWRQLLDEAITDLRTVRSIRTIRLLQSANEIVPITFGTLRPALMIPASADSWSDDRRRAVLLHELAHVARRDCLSQLVGAIACAIYWPHPGVWWAARRLRVERELACDDRVIAAGAEPHAYAGHLLELARSLPAAPAPATALAMTRVRDLETRLRALVSARNRSALRRRGAVVAIATSIAVLLPLASLRAVPRADASRAFDARRTGFGALRSIASAAQGTQDLSGTWDLRLSADGATAHLTVRAAHSSHGETLPTARLEALAGVRIAGASGPVHFSIRRDAGTFVGDGTCRGGVCAGTGRFESDAAFASELTKRGIGAPSPADALQLAVHDVGYAFLDEIGRDGYAKPDVQGLVRAAKHGVGTEYVHEMTALGYRLVTLDGLLQLRDHGVDPAYVRGMAANGLARLSADDLVSARDHGVDPSYVEGMRALGFSSLDLAGLITARDHGIDPQYARGMQDLGYRLPLADLRQARDHGVDPEYVRELAGLGYTNVPLGDLLAARGHGIDAQYARGMRDLGYRLSLGELSLARDHGVDPTYASRLAGLGYVGLPLDTLLRLRDHGVDPDYVRRLKEKGITQLTPDQLIERRDRGIDDPTIAAREVLSALQSYWRSLVGRR